MAQLLGAYDSKKTTEARSLQKQIHHLETQTVYFLQGQGPVRAEGNWACGPADTSARLAQSLSGRPLNGVKRRVLECNSPFKRVDVRCVHWQRLVIGLTARRQNLVVQGMTSQFSMQTFTSHMHAPTCHSQRHLRQDRFVGHRQLLFRSTGKLVTGDHRRRWLQSREVVWLYYHIRKIIVLMPCREAPSVSV